MHISCQLNLRKVFQKTETKKNYQSGIQSISDSLVENKLTMQLQKIQEKKPRQTVPRTQNRYL